MGAEAKVNAADVSKPVEQRMFPRLVEPTWQGQARAGVLTVLQRVPDAYHGAVIAFAGESYRHTQPRERCTWGWCGG